MSPANLRLAVAGWILYAVSWLTPSSDGAHTGAWAFLTTAKTAVSILEAGKVTELPLGLALLLGWSANFSILFRLPVWARISWSIAAWCPFVIALLMLPVRPSIPQRAMYLLYFYPWALGIALIHIAHIAEARKND